MKRVAFLVAITGCLLLAASCADQLIVPEEEEVETFTGKSTVTGINPDGDEECDPYMDANWCDDPMDDPDVDPDDDTGGGGSSGTDSDADNPDADDDEPPCDPAVDPNCEADLTGPQWMVINVALDNYVFTEDQLDASVRAACVEAIDELSRLRANQLLVVGSTEVGDDAVPHDAAFNPNNGKIHLDAEYLDDQNTPLWDIANSLLHEAMHSLNYSHSNSFTLPGPLAAYGFQYLEVPYQHLNFKSVGANESCINYPALS